MDSQADWCFVCSECCKFIRSSNMFLRHKRTCFKNFKFSKTGQSGSGENEIRVAKLGPCEKVDCCVPLKQSTDSFMLNGSEKLALKTNEEIKNLKPVPRQHLELDGNSDSATRFVATKFKNDASVLSVICPVAQETDVKVKVDITEPRPVKIEKNSQTTVMTGSESKNSYLKLPRLLVHLQRCDVTVPNLVKTESGIENIWKESNPQGFFKKETKPDTVVIASAIVSVPLLVSSTIEDTAEVKAVKSREKIQKNQGEANGTFPVEKSECIITNDDTSHNDKEENLRVTDDVSSSIESSESIVVRSKPRKTFNGSALAVKFKCPSCPKVYLLEEGFKKHVEDHVNNFSKLKCSFCDKNFASLQNKRRHERNIHAKTPESQEKFKKHQCTVCKKRFLGKQALTYHIRTHTGEKPYACRFCPKKFASTLQRRLHEKCMHGTDPTFRESFKEVCAICSKKFMNSYLLDLHMRSHTGRKPFSCDFCPKTFSQRAHKKAHTLSMHPDEEHLDENGQKLHFHQCSKCPKKFYSKPDLERHELVHSGEMPFKCRFCAAKFNLAGNQNRHEIDVHYDQLDEEKIANKHKCEWCSKIFYAKSELEIHKRVHNATRDLKCEYCSMKYTTSGALTRHLRLNHGDLEGVHPAPLPPRRLREKDIKANSCPPHGNKTRNRTRESLKKSLGRDQVLNKKCYKCLTCSKNFKILSYFEKHKLECNTTKMFICRFCPRDFLLTSTQLNHEVAIHSEQMNPQELVRLPRCKLCLKYFVHKCTLLKHEEMHAITKKTRILNRSSINFSQRNPNNSQLHCEKTSGRD